MERGLPECEGEKSECRLERLVKFVSLSNTEKGNGSEVLFLDKFKIQDGEILEKIGNKVITLWYIKL